MFEIILKPEDFDSNTIDAGDKSIADWRAETVSNLFQSAQEQFDAWHNARIAGLPTNINTKLGGMSADDEAWGCGDIGAPNKYGVC